MGSSYRQTAFENLGLASHYLSDVGQPMHTGLEYQSYVNDNLHIQYEQYVDNNWNSGHNFARWATRNTEVKSITNPSQATKDLAAFSKSYCSQLWGEMIKPNYDTTLTQYITSVCLKETAKYNAGLAKYIRT
jgi:hypothetical protein